MQGKKIVLASDHAGYDVKKILAEYLQKKEYVVLDLGSFDSTTPVDYPDQVTKLARAISRKEADIGILTCGSGIGMSIAVNRYPFLRGALVCDEEMARLGRAHNNANVIILAGRLIEPANAIKCLEVFLNTPFDGGRHEIRVKKLSELPAEL